MEKDGLVRQQAEAFLNYFYKLLRQEFELWSESKDFVEFEKRAIYQECLRTVNSQGRVSYSTNCKQMNLIGTVRSQENLRLRGFPVAIMPRPASEE